MNYFINNTDQLFNLVCRSGYQLVIFDFDGTLVNTFKDVAICFNEALKYHGLPEQSLEYIKGLIGGNLETIVSNLIPESKRERPMIEAVKATYRYLYLKSNKSNSLPYKGVMELLDKFSDLGILLAINSNKGQVLLDSMVNILFKPDTFMAVVGYDERFPSKPDPYGAKTIMSLCGVKKEHTLYVGDGNSDMFTANNAEIDFCHVEWEQ